MVSETRKKEEDIELRSTNVSGGSLFPGKSAVSWSESEEDSGADSKKKTRYAHSSSNCQYT